MKSYDRLFIGGDWVAPSSSSVFDVHSPSTGELVGRTPEAMQADIDRAVAAAREAVDSTGLLGSAVAVGPRRVETPLRQSECASGAAPP